jgi:hypothetical protein
MCEHTALLAACFDGFVPETGRPTYAPTTDAQLRACFEHIWCSANVEVQS